MSLIINLSGVPKFKVCVNLVKKKYETGHAWNRCVGRMSPFIYTCGDIQKQICLWQNMYRLSMFLGRILCVIPKYAFLETCEQVGYHIRVKNLQDPYLIL